MYLPTRAPLRGIAVVAGHARQLMAMCMGWCALRLSRQRSIAYARWASARTAKATHDSCSGAQSRGAGQTMDGVPGRGSPRIDEIN